MGTCTLRNEVEGCAALLTGLVMTTEGSGSELVWFMAVLMSSRVENIPHIHRVIETLRLSIKSLMLIYFGLLKTGWLFIFGFPSFLIIIFIGLVVGLRIAIIWLCAADESDQAFHAYIGIYTSPELNDVIILALESAQSCPDYLIHL